MRIVLGTTNTHKIREILSIFKPLRKINFLTLNDFPNYQQPEETGVTFEENARLKAIHASSTIKEWVLADDSGLVVPSLNGEPGVFSARYAGENATDQQNCLKLRRNLEKTPENDRFGYLVCVLVLSSPNGVEEEVKGICEGELVTDPKGKNGFGYDPIFKSHNCKKTFAELDEETKNQISHRRKALEKMMPILANLAQEDLLEST